MFVVQTNDIANLKNMPVINKRLNQNAFNAGVVHIQQHEEEKNGGNNYMVIDKGK